jgi:hypothetical protein
MLAMAEEKIGINYQRIWLFAHPYAEPFYVKTWLCERDGDGATLQSGGASI